jgi:dihydroorotate dehydrogenase
MSLVPYGLARPFLFGLDPETAHELTLHALARAQGTPLQWAYCNGRVDDAVELAGLTFPNRVGLAAGLDKNARCIDGLGAMGFGFVEVGTVTPLAQSGNPKPRMQRSNLYRQRQLSPASAHPATRPAPMLLGLNIGKNAATPIENATQDYLTCLDGVYPYADYVTVNISSPNTKNLRALQSDEALDALLGAITERREALSQRHARRIPIFVKIAPDLTDEQVDVIATTLRRYGLDRDGQPNNAWGVVATNTTLNRDAVKGLAHADEAGGLSGAPVLALSNHIITRLRTALGQGVPIIGVGGILNSQDAADKIKAGADVVQIYTGLIYKGPNLVKEAALLIKDSV